MKILCFILFILLISCNQNESQANGLNKDIKILDSIIVAKKYIIDKKYNPLSLNYNGKPLSIIGENSDSLVNTSFTFREDPNLEFQDYYGLISDYLSMDDKIRIQLDENNSINGIVFFSSLKNNRQVFTFSGNWTIDSEINDEKKQIIADSITKKLFPKLKGKIDIEDGWNYKIASRDFIENFEIVAPKEDKSIFWNLKYNVTLK